MDVEHLVRSKHAVEIPLREIDPIDATLAVACGYPLQNERQGCKREMFKLQWLHIGTLFPNRRALWRPEQENWKMPRAFLVVVGAVLSIAICGAIPAAAFKDTDLEEVAQRAQAALGQGFRVQVGNRQRVVLMCASCAGPTMVTIQIGRQTDGTEDRVRGGQTTVADLERLCQANEPTCRIERADTGPAVGWVSTYRGASVSGSTLVLLRSGDMLTLRSTAQTQEAARENVRRLQRSVLPQIIGR